MASASVLVAHESRQRIDWIATLVSGLKFGVEKFSLISELVERIGAVVAEQVDAPVSTHQRIPLVIIDVDLLKESFEPIRVIKRSEPGIHVIIVGCRFDGMIGRDAILKEGAQPVLMTDLAAELQQMLCHFPQYV